MPYDSDGHSTSSRDSGAVDERRAMMEIMKETTKDIIREGRDLLGATVNNVGPLRFDA